MLTLDESIYKILFIAAAAIFTLSCEYKKEDTIEDKRISVVATTTMISDMVVQIAKDKVNLKSLMGPGVDPHLYEPIPTDAIALVEADIIFYNGLKLEVR